MDAFAITVRRKSFKLPIKSLCVEQLDLTIPYDCAPTVNEPSGLRYVIGARRFGYAESYSFGNPGAYQTYLLSFNDAGVGDFPIIEGHCGFSVGDLVLVGDDLESKVPDVWYSTHREDFKPNTIAVLANLVSVDAVLNYVSVGVDVDDVRQIPE